MIVLTSAQKAILLSNSVKKTWTFEVYNGSTYVDSIPTSKMVADGFSIKEPICTARSLEIGACEAAVLSVKVANIDIDLKGKKIKVALTATDGATSVNMPMGVFYVDEVKNQNNTYFYTITAYDGMSLFDVNVAEWYDSLTFPLTLKAMRTSLCSYIGVSQESVTLPNDNVSIEKTVSASDLTGRDVLKSICAINGCFGHFTRTGTLTYLFLGDSSAVTLTKGGEGYYQTSATHEQWTVAAFDAVTVLPDEDSIGGIYPANGGNNILKISDNFLSYDKSTEDLTAIAQAIYPYVSNRPYVVHSTPTRGRPWIEAGDKITIQTEKNGVTSTINTYVLNRTFTGFQGCMDKYEAAGTEEVNSDKSSVNVQITQLKGKTNKLIRTVDEMISEIADMDKGYKSAIQQLSNQISVIVSAEDNSINAASIVAAINNNESSIKISADKINLSGYVTISSLAEGGSTVIDGSRITTGTISAERLDLTGALTAMQADIEEIIADKITTAELDADQITTGTISAERLDLEGLVTDSELTSELRSYVTSSELSTTLSSYVTGSALTNRLSSYVTSSAMETTLSSYALTTDLEGLVTDSELTSELRSYVTSSELTNTISSYATKTGGTSSSFSYSLTSTAFTLKADGSTVFNATSSGVSITGTITIKNGSSAGGWTISTNEMYTDSAGISASDDYTKDSLVTGGTSPVRFYCGNGNRTGGKFVVLDDGSLYATAAKIEGTIITNNATITGGKISFGKSTEKTYLTLSETGIKSGVSDYNTQIRWGGIETTWSEWGDDTSTVHYGSYSTDGMTSVYGIHAVLNPYDTNYWCISAYGGQFGDTGWVSIGFNMSSSSYSNSYAQLSGTWKGSLTASSDRNLKNSIETLSEKYDIFFDLIQPVRYKFNDGTSNRYHTGFIAQDVEKALIEAGLTTNEAALFVKFETENLREKTVDVSYGLRYDEFICINTRQIQMLKARVSELEAQLQSIQRGD